LEKSSYNAISVRCSRLHSARFATFWRKLAISQHTEPVINFIACASIFFTMRHSSANTALEHRQIFPQCHFASTPPVDCQAKSPGGAHHPLCQSSGNGLGVYIIMPGQRPSCLCCLAASWLHRQCAIKKYIPRGASSRDYTHNIFLHWRQDGSEIYIFLLCSSLLAQYFFSCIRLQVIIN